MYSLTIDNAESILHEYERTYKFQLRKTVEIYEWIQDRRKKGSRIEFT